MFQLKYRKEKRTISISFKEPIETLYEQYRKLGPFSLFFLNAVIREAFRPKYETKQLKIKEESVNTTPPLETYTINSTI